MQVNQATDRDLAFGSRYSAIQVERPSIIRIAATERQSNGKVCISSWCLADSFHLGSRNS
jgi:hypothetical protein